MSTANQQVSAVQTDAMDASNETVTKADSTVPQIVGRVIIPTTPSIISTSSIATTQTVTTTSATGRPILPVVYFNLPRGRVTAGGSPATVVVNANNPSGSVVLNHVAQVLPTGARGNTFIPALTPKITVNASTNSTTPTSSISQAVTPGSQQATFVTIHAPVRTSAQSSNTNTLVTSGSQPHFVTIPKESLSDSTVGMTLKSIVTQASGQQPHFVTLQAPIAQKTNFTATTGSGQYVTIRTPILASGSPGGSAVQNQFVTIQAPVLQTGSNQATFVPMPAASGTALKAQQHTYSYLSPVLKNGTIPNLVSSSPKMMLSTIPTLQKTLAAPASQTANILQTTPSPAATQATSGTPTANIVAFSRNVPNPAATVLPSKSSNTETTGSPTISIATIPGTNIVTISRPCANPTVTVVQAKDVADAQTTQAITVRNATTPARTVLSQEATDTNTATQASPAAPQTTTATTANVLTLSRNAGNPNVIVLPARESVHTNTATQSLSSMTAANILTLSRNAGNPNVIVLPARESVDTNTATQPSPAISHTTTPTPNIVTLSRNTGGPNVIVLPARESVDTNTATQASPPVCLTTTTTANILTLSRNAGNPNVLVLPARESADTNTATQASPVMSLSNTTTANILTLSRNAGNPNVLVLPARESADINIATQASTVMPLSAAATANILSLSRNAGNPNVIVLPAKESLDTTIVNQSAPSVSAGTISTANLVISRNVANPSVTVFSSKEDKETNITTSTTPATNTLIANTAPVSKPGLNPNMVVRTVANPSGTGSSSNDATEMSITTSTTPFTNATTANAPVSKSGPYPSIVVRTVANSSVSDCSPDEATDTNITISTTPVANARTANIVPVSTPGANPNVIVLPAEETADASIVTQATPYVMSVTKVAAEDLNETAPSQTVPPVASVPTTSIATCAVSAQKETTETRVVIETARSCATTGNSTIPTVPAKQPADENSETAQRPIQTRITVLPFSLSSEMTVTPANSPGSPSGSNEETLQIGKEDTPASVVPVAADKKSNCPPKLNGVSLPDSTTLTPIIEQKTSSLPNILRRDFPVRRDSMIVQKESVEMKIRADTRKATSLICNNVNLPTPPNPAEITEDTSKQLELNKCLQEAVDEIFSAETPPPVSSESAAPTTTIITCGEDDDEVTLIKVSETEETPPKFTAPLDDPDDIKIEVIKLPVKDATANAEHKVDSEEVSIKIEPKSKCRSPSPPPLISSDAPPASATTASAPKPGKVAKLLPGQSVSSLRCSSVLKSQIVSRANLLLSGNHKKKSTPKVTSLLKPPNEDAEKNESPASTPATAEDFDPMSALEWKDGIGLLPGSNLQFRMNEFGLIEMVSDDDKDQEGKKPDSQQSSQNSDEVTGEGSEASSDDKEEKPVKAKPEAFKDDDDKKQYGPEDIIRCQFCGCYGLAVEFFNNRFCSNACSDSAAVKKANEFKREQDHRALKLRRKRRRLERMCERQEIKKEEVEYLMDMDDLNDEKASQTVLKSNSSNPTPIASDDDVSVTSNDAQETWKSKGGKQAKSNVQFTWVKYLDAQKAKAAPAKLFKDDNLYTKNKFKIGWKLEGIDPEHPAHFCVLTVAEVRGYRLRLHFDGFADCHDFWVNVDSPEIFPVGWCLKNGRRLSPPRGYTSQNFNWATYLKACRAFPAPRHLFTKSASNVCPNGFRIGMKLEALDRKDTSAVCVATVNDVLDNRILIHFDSWDDMYDYWADPSSPYIHPVGWCEENNATLTPPNQFKDPSDFSWSTYLKQTKSIPAPARAFKQRHALGFKRGMRLEAVDKRVPHLIRVATVEESLDHRLLIHFDGWPEFYDYWVDEDSPDIHRAGWCRDTKHPLEAPLTKEDLSDTSHCPTPGCKGEGHIKGPKFGTHSAVQNCPYAPENMNREGIIPDRLYSKSEMNEMCEIPLPPEKPMTASLNNTLRLVEGRRPLGRPPKWRRLAEEEENRRKRRRTSDDDRHAEKRSVSPLESASKLQLELHQSVFEPGYKVDFSGSRSACWAKHSLPLHSSPMLTDDTDPQSWGPDEVAKFVSTVAGLEERAQAFTDEEIDGEALLLMTQQDLVENLGLKLGPAIKLYNSIVLLRQKGT